MALAHRVLSQGRALAEAAAIAEQLAKFPQVCMRGDRLSTYLQPDLSLDAALRPRDEGAHAGSGQRSVEVCGW
jgi:enoyl-CoA hydratase